MRKSSKASGNYCEEKAKKILEADGWLVGKALPKIAWVRYLLLESSA